ncbi:MAG: hypothetical protein RO469_18385 [Thermincola sp.]|jgi:hypothetical protein|nr:hypothetical protein [Thermincola sp.]MDT3703850.1 hypothetical protein [Thermincola sp.]
MYIGISIVGLLAIVVFLVLLPLIQNSSDGPGDLLIDLEEPSFLEKSKESVFTTINEIEFDYRMKKLSDDDYNQLKNDYKQKALEILHEEDEEELETERPDRRTGNSPEQEIEKEIEKELAMLRRQQNK